MPALIIRAVTLKILERYEDVDITARYSTFVCRKFDKNEEKMLRYLYENVEVSVRKCRDIGTKFVPIVRHFPCRNIDIIVET